MRTPEPRAVYRRLLEAFGPQGWWPVTPAGARAPKYRPGRGGALTERQRAEVCAGAILTQNTNWGNVEKALIRLHEAGVWDHRHLAAAPARRLERLIRSSGYFRQKARKLRVFARHAAGRGRSLRAWLSQPLPALRRELLGLWGVGPETADSILLYAGGRPAFVIDAYTLRIGRRLGWFGAVGYERAQTYLTGKLPRSAVVYAEFHALLVALAKKNCRTRPLCGDCSLAGVCRFARAALAAVLIVLAFGLRAQAGLSAAAAKVDITPDLAKERVYMAGFGATGRRPWGVHDPLYARILLVSDGKKTVGLVAVDLLGLYRNDVQDIRRLAGFDEPDQYLLIAATHEHSGPDTMSLWGPMIGISGVNSDYQRRIKERIAAAVAVLRTQLQDVDVSGASEAIDPGGLCRDSRNPTVIDPYLGTLTFRTKGGRTVATVVNWSCHPEVLGRDNRLITADYPGPLCDRVEERLGGTCVFLNGPIGGLMTPEIRAGRENFYEAYRIGSELADRAVAQARRAKARGARAALAFDSRVVLVPVENSRYLLFLPALTFGHRLLDRSGRALPRWAQYWLPLKEALRLLTPEQRPWVETEVSLLDIGPARILGIPGEIFPELVIGGYDGRFRFGHPLIDPGNPDPPDLKRAPAGPYLWERIDSPVKMVAGLANDELGYVIPGYDFKVQKSVSMLPRLPGHHYEETNSIGPSATKILVGAAEDLLSR